MSVYQDHGLRLCLCHKVATVCQCSYWS